MAYHISKMEGNADLSGRDFVGLSESDEYDLDISVPYGVSLPDIISDSDFENIRFLKRYVRVIQKALNSARVKQSLEKNTLGLKNPLAGMKIACDFVLMGPIIEYEVTEQKAETGKINFDKTVKNITPLFINEEFIYDKYIIEKKRIKNDNFVATVQANVINHFMKNGGELIFGSRLKVSAKPIRLDKKTIVLLRRELNQTFNSREQNVIRWMISYIEGIDITEEKGQWEYAIIASTLWETMINSIFGNQTRLDKSLYGKRYPFVSLRTGAVIKKGSPTEHDTIFEDDESVFIIDAKMYGSEDYLLSEEVLGKQFGYYLEARVKRPSKTVINILFLPALTGEKNGFSDKVIVDPHTRMEDDPDKIIFLYKYSANQIIDDYYYSRKKVGMLKREFIDFISEPYVRDFLKKANPTDSRICTYAMMWKKYPTKK